MIWPCPVHLLHGLRLQMLCKGFRSKVIFYLLIKINKSVFYLSSAHKFYSMRLKEFWKPNKKIALILILIPLFIKLLSLFVNYVPIPFDNKNLFFELLVGPIVPGMFIAASLLLKFRKTLYYYLTFFLPYVLLVISILLFTVIRTSSLLGVSTLNFIFLTTAILVVTNLVINPIFLIFLPFKLKLKNVYAKIFIADVAFYFVSKYVYSFVLNEILKNPMYVSTQDIASDLVYMSLIFVFAFLFFGKFSKMLKKK